MDVTKIVAEIDAQITSLQHARAVLSGLNGTSAELKPRRGRPRGSVNKGASTKAAGTKRTLSPEGRKRIAEAMKRRWAERRKDVSKKEAVKK